MPICEGWQLALVCMEGEGEDGGMFSSSSSFHARIPLCSTHVSLPFPFIIDWLTQSGGLLAERAYRGRRRQEELEEEEEEEEQEGEGQEEGEKERGCGGGGGEKGEEYHPLDVEGERRAKEAWKRRWLQAKRRRVRRR